MSTLSLFSFFNYTAQALFDPRILYDLTYNRWIVSAEAFPESATVQRQFIAVSVDSNPTHGFFIYDFNARDWIGSGVFWDYPQIGYDEDAVILTGNGLTPASSRARRSSSRSTGCMPGWASATAFSTVVRCRGHVHAANRPGPGTLYHDRQRGTRRRLHQGDKVD